MAEKKKRSFGHVMLLYALVFFALLLAVLAALHLYLVYAASRGPDEAMRAWVETLDEAQLRAGADARLAAFDETLFPPDELFADRAAPLLAEELSFRACPGGNGDDVAVYTLLAGEKVVGRVALSPQDPDALGVRRWRIDTCDLSLLGDPVSRTLTVPEGFSVVCGGRPLDASYISARSYGCEALGYLAEAGYALPAFVTYTAERCPAWAAFTVIAPDGTEYPPDADFSRVAAEALANSCSESERERLESFAGDFCEAYVAFLGTRRDAVGGNYRKILPFLLEGSDLYERMVSARKGLVWSHNRKNEIVAFRPNACMRLAEGEYLCDFSFAVDTLGLAGTVRTENNVRLFVTEQDGELYAAQLFSYG